ncbi:MutS protein msh4 [Rhizoclosmatium sp. JEL0117]|nr:MutS protein msh4 [Rhizoclosmatium sp. JEL0117]
MARPPRRRPSTSTSTTTATTATTNTSSVFSSHAAQVQVRPSTAASAATTTSMRDVVAAVSEGRGVSAEVAVVCFDKAAAEISISQFADGALYGKTLQQLSLVDPSEILVSQTAMEPVKSRLVEILEANFGQQALVPVNRSYFNQSRGLQNIQDFSWDETIIPGLSNKLYYATSCVAAILTFIEERDDITFYRRSLKFKFFSADGTMSIDHITARNLELIFNLQTNKTINSLFGILSASCQTSMGSRLVRMNVLQPLNDLETIEARLDAVQALKENPHALSGLRTCLKESVDMDSLITSLLYRPKKHSTKVTETHITALILLKHVLSKWITSLHDTIVDLPTPLLELIASNRSNENLARLLSLINERINEDIVWQKSAQGMRNQRCYAIKAGWNGLLDVARQTYRESTNDVYELVASYTTRYGYPLKTNFTNTQGYTLKLSVSDLEASENPGQLPIEFINVIKSKKTISFTTLPLLGLNDRINESLMEVYLMSDRMIGELVGEVTQFAGSLYKISESIALLDMLSAFAFDADQNEYVRPEFTETCIDRGSNVSIQYKYHIQDGTPTFENYGLTIARIVQFPDETISLALRVSDLLVMRSKDVTARRRGDAEEEVRLLAREEERLYHRLVQVRLNSRLEEGRLREYLKGLQAEVV